MTDQQTRDTIKELFQQGYTIYRICRMLGVGDSVVRRTLQKAGLLNPNGNKPLPPPWETMYIFINGNPKRKTRKVEP